MRKSVLVSCVATISMGILYSTAGDLSNPAVMMQAADKAVSGAIVPPLVNPTVASGVAVTPTVGGAAVSANVGQTAASVKQVGVWETIKNIPNMYPKTTASIGMLAAAIPIIANNPKLLGLDKKSDSSTPSTQANGNTALDNGIHTTISGNNNVVNVFSNRDSDNGK